MSIAHASCGYSSDATNDASVHLTQANMAYRMTGQTGSLCYMAPEVLPLLPLLGWPVVLVPCCYCLYLAGTCYASPVLIGARGAVPVPAPATRPAVCHVFSSISLLGKWASATCQSIGLTLRPPHALKAMLLPQQLEAHSGGSVRGYGNPRGAALPTFRHGD